jgi:hypothetical protein
MFCYNSSEIFSLSEKVSSSANQDNVNLSSTIWQLAPFLIEILAAPWFAPHHKLKLYIVQLYQPNILRESTQ